MSEQGVKVSDRRMFTPEGELKDEFRHLENKKPEAPAAAAEPAPEPRREPPPEPRREAQPAPPPASGYPPAAPAEGPGFFDLVSLLAEPASLYLREAQMAPRGTVAGDGQFQETLQYARLHIDLLSVLREKAAGNLTRQEEAALNDVIFRLQTGFVQTRK